MISVIFHLLLLLVWGIWGDTEKNAMKIKEELAQKREKQDKRLVFELIETPEATTNEEPDRETTLVSDKSMKASDQAPADLSEGDPYSQGIVDSRNFASINQQEFQEKPETKKMLKEENPDTQTQEEISGSKIKEDIKLDAEKVEMKSENVQVSKLKNLLFNNPKSRAIEKGGISFNTYAWDYAPYMLALKKRIGENLNLPYAFTGLGMIGGDVLVRFVVSPGGDLKLNEIVLTNAHESLQKASQAAIHKSFPFLPLPKDFPEDQLIVTAKFSYIINK